MIMPIEMPGKATGVTGLYASDTCSFEWRDEDERCGWLLITGKLDALPGRPYD
jgi:hypothetical protein